MSIKRPFNFVGMTLLMSIFLLSQSSFAAETLQKEVKVSYKNAATVETPDYIITIPLSLQFSSDNRKLNTAVSMFDLDGKYYDGDLSAEVNVTSKHSYRLISPEKSDYFNYQLFKYNDNNIKVLINNKDNSIGKLSKDKTKIDGEAYLYNNKIVDVDSQTIYEDVLTYEILTSQ